MASVKIFSLVVRTLAKPIANTIKDQAAQHESFRKICIGLAQRMHQTEAKMRMNLLNESPKDIRPLNDTRAVQNGATTLAETFLFLVGAGLVFGESWRSSRKEEKRRDEVAERLDSLEQGLGTLKDTLEGGSLSRALSDVREQNQNLQRVLDTVVTNGLRAGWISMGHADGVGDVLPLLNPQRPQDSLRKGGESPITTGRITSDNDNAT